LRVAGIGTNAAADAAVILTVPRIVGAVSVAAIQPPWVVAVDRVVENVHITVPG
jgi:hypothetical protein